MADIPSRPPGSPAPRARGKAAAVAEPAPDLVRNYSTEVVHRATCSTRGDSAYWHWADDRTLADVSQATREHPWLHLCRICLPGVCACGKCSSDG